MNNFISSSAYVSPDTRMGSNCHIEPGAFIGRWPRKNNIGNHVFAPYYISVQFGAEVVIGANSVIYREVRLGDRVVVCDLSSIRESTIIDDDSLIGRGVTINYGVTIGKRTRITDLCHICNNAVIGNDVFIGPGVLTAVDENIYLSRLGIAPLNFKPPIICDKALIGAGAIIMPGVEIGEGAVVAAGSIVTRSVAPYHLVMGQPAIDKGEYKEAKTLREHCDSERY